MMQEKIPMQHKNISFLFNALFITNLKMRDIKKADSSKRAINLIVYRFKSY